jgi:hypothetical protein
LRPEFGGLRAESGRVLRRGVAAMHDAVAASRHFIPCCTPPAPARPSQSILDEQAQRSDFAWVKRKQGKQAGAGLRCAAFGIPSRFTQREEITMRFRTGLRAALVALTAAFAGLAFAPAAYADSGTISFSVVKAGFVIGGQGGRGVLHFHGRNYPVSIGGLSYGFTFGASETRFHGRVSHIRRASDVAGVYGAAGAGAAIGRGAQAIVLSNQNGAVLTLSGEQRGVIVSADLSGLALTLR